MITIIIVIAICIAIGCLLFKEDIEIGVMTGLFVGLLIGGFVCGLATVIFNPKTITTEQHTYWMYNLQDNSKTEGNFCIFSGHVNENMVYTFYIQGEHGFVPVNLLVEECAIVERNGKPEVIKRCTNYVNKHWNPWVFSPSERPKYIIYVPKGTIVRNFSLDAKY